MKWNNRNINKMRTARGEDHTIVIIKTTTPHTPLGSPKGSLTIDPGAKLPPLNLFAFPLPLATTCAVAPLNLSGRAERTLAVSEYISLVTLVTLRIVPERLILGLGTVF
jgi:hypothetical protein